MLYEIVIQTLFHPFCGRLYLMLQRIIFHGKTPHHIFEFTKGYLNLGGLNMWISHNYYRIHDHPVVHLVGKPIHIALQLGDSKNLLHPKNISAGCAAWP